MFLTWYVVQAIHATDTQHILPLYISISVCPTCSPLSFFLFFLLQYPHFHSLQIQNFLSLHVPFLNHGSSLCLFFWHRCCSSTQSTTQDCHQARCQIHCHGVWYVKLHLEKAASFLVYSWEMIDPFSLQQQLLIFCRRIWCWQNDLCEYSFYCFHQGSQEPS